MAGADPLVGARRLGSLLSLRRRTGALKNQITSGEFVTTSLEGIDEKARVALLHGRGREKGEDPYYTHLYRVGLDGTGLKLLDPGRRLARGVGQSDRRSSSSTTRRASNGAPESSLYDTLGNGRH